MSGKMEKSEAQWHAELTPEQFDVLGRKETEHAFTGGYWDSKTPGTYRFAGCGEPLFTSEAKFDSGCGWPKASTARRARRVSRSITTPATA